VHPGKKKVMRSYGYVGNVVWQIMKIVGAPREVVNEKVFYVGDMPVDLYEWVNGFSMQQAGKRVVVVPRGFVRTLAVAGDALKLIGVRFPITSSRYRSMTTSNAAPMERTFEMFGCPPFSLNEGIRQTVEWMRKYHPELIRI